MTKSRRQTYRGEFIHYSLLPFWAVRVSDYIKLDVLITIHIAKYSVSWDLADARVFVLNKRGHRLV